MKISQLLRQAAPVYRITVTDPLKGWLNLDKKTIYKATRELVNTDTYWHLISLKKDVPDYVVHVISTNQEYRTLKSKGYKEV